MELSLIQFSVFIKRPSGCGVWNLKNKNNLISLSNKILIQKLSISYSLFANLNSYIRSINIFIWILTVTVLPHTNIVIPHGGNATQLLIIYTFVRALYVSAVFMVWDSTIHKSFIVHCKIIVSVCSSFSTTKILYYQTCQSGCVSLSCYCCCYL